MHNSKPDGDQLHMSSIAREHLTKHDRKRKSKRKKKLQFGKEVKKGDINKGDLIMQSSPFAFVIFTTHRYTILPY